MNTAFFPKASIILNEFCNQATQTCMYIHFTLLFKSVDNANQQFVFPFFIEGKNQKTPPPKKKTQNNKLKKQKYFNKSNNLS